MKNIIGFILALCLLSNCDSSVNTNSNNKANATSSKAKSSTNDAILGKDMHQIVVNEKIESGGYVYIKVTENNKEYWMAVPGRPVEIGATYYYKGGMEMQNFRSKTLNKTFESVIFAEGIHEDLNNMGGVAKKQAPQGKPTVGKIEKAANGIQIAELFENPKHFENKEVIIKGEVVKVNNGIMNTNFVHLQDGTIGNGEYDITLTTDDTFEVGEVVTIKGNVILNKNFGSGYVYDILVEEAVKLKKI
ncbi:DNA-binding protein [Flammeovirga sp. MY04]|uniref:hypothetical protein n=1 Tax=Flammeovirga sp. MY04 TaxID=1191459 RepID=UPI00080623D9|nr:hypothetical protein [Flammeovirga sp. MY04]ANQ49478.1 DNA-binding protein [Flammeovirga sp. MY04]